MTGLLIALLTHGLVAVIAGYVSRVVTLRTARHWPDRPHLGDVMHGDRGQRGQKGERGQKGKTGTTRHTFGADNGGETPQEGKARRNLRDNGRLSVVLVVASLFVVALGIQAWMEQRDQAADDRREDKQVACFEQWGKDFVDTATTRTDSTIELEAAEKRLQRAESRRDAGIDRIFLIVIAFREVPPRATEDDFNRALAEYQKALTARDRIRDHLEGVRDQVDGIRASNPYPELHC